MLQVLLAAALQTATPTPVPAPTHITIYVDNRDSACLLTRAGKYRRWVAEQKALKLKRELEAEGRTVKIVHIDGRTRVGSFGAWGAPVFVGKC